ncbi:MAG: hypothetical protein R2939_04305 [Kofleriaceae bacterium]
MTTPRACDLLAARLADEGDLGDLADHAATCPACRRLVALPALHAPPAPLATPAATPGFEARITAGAQHRLATRRRRRQLAWAATGVAAAASMALWLVRAEAPTAPAVGAMDALRDPRPPWTSTATDLEQPPAVDDGDVSLSRALVELARDALHRPASPTWRAIEARLDRYDLVLTSTQGTR